MKHAGLIEIEANGTGKEHRMDPSFKRTGRKREGGCMNQPLKEKSSKKLPM